MDFSNERCHVYNIMNIRWLTAVLCLAAWAGVAGLNPAAWAQEAPESFARLAEEVAPPVVNISTTQKVEGRPVMPWYTPEGPLEEYFDRFFEGLPRAPRQTQALGSGFLIDGDGHIFTNNHVIARATEIRVRFQNGEEYEAEVVGRDPKTDLALIRIKTDDQLPEPAQLGDSEALQVGDWVLAVGNPFGLGHSVTAGIIGAKSRVIGAGPYDDFLQTDAAINPGNSGGPLFDAGGKVVGINTAIVAQGQGIGFAIPVNMAKELLPQLKAGKVVRGYLGVGIQDVTPELAEAFGLDAEEGVIVTNVMENTPAAEAGLQEGDIIASVNDQPIESAGQLSATIAGMAPGAEAILQILRDGEQNQITVTLGRLPGTEAAREAPAQERPRWGLAIQDITPEMAQRFDLGTTEGVIISQVAPGSPADEAGLRRGDIIRAVGRQKVGSTEEFMQIIRNKENEQRLALRVQRNENFFYTVLEAPPDEQ